MLFPGIKKCFGTARTRAFAIGSFEISSTTCMYRVSFGAQFEFIDKSSNATIGLKKNRVFFFIKSGGDGIRTHERGNPFTGFQDRRLQPLGHPTVGMGIVVLFTKECRRFGHQRLLGQGGCRHFCLILYQVKQHVLE